MGNYKNYCETNPIFQSLKEAVRRISKVNNYNFTEQDCINVCNQLWNDFDFIKYPIKYADDYYNIKQ